MWYGALTFITGPMFAGKSTELLKRILWAQHGQNRRILVLKPARDDRYGIHEIISHDGLRADALAISRLPEVTEDIHHVFIDEAQFFYSPDYEGDLPKQVRALLGRGIDVTCTGLDLDWQGKPFDICAQLIAMADHVLKITANCTVCGQAAPKTYKKTPDGQKVAVGGTDQYEARCNLHWLRDAETEGNMAA